MEKVGQEGVITVEEGKGFEFDLETVEGMQFDRGYLSLIVTNAEKMTAELDNPFILLFEKKLSGLQPMLPLLEAVVRLSVRFYHRRRCRRRRPVTLVVKWARGGQKCSSEGTWFGDRRKSMLETSLS